MMNGLWILMLADLRVGLEVAGGEDWFAVRVVALSPLLEIGVHSEWVAAPRAAS